MNSIKLMTFRSFLLTFVLTSLLLSKLSLAETLDYRLSKNIQPTNQYIALDLDPESTHYQGTTTIDIIVTTEVDSIGLYWLDLNIQSAQLTSTTSSRLLQASDEAYDIHQLGDGKKIASGTYQLTLTFDAEFSTDALGLYRTNYQGQHYLFTQFEALFARRAFPLFDEPDFKIPYQFTLTVPKALEVATNTPMVTEQIKDNKKTVTFAVSQPMPSYLLALTVGPFDKTPITGLSVPGVIYSPKGTGKQTGFAIKHTPKILQVLEQYFAIDYPFDKLDFVAVPDYAFGAMENPGLVTYRTELLLVGDDATANTAEDSLNVIAHELAHMWYGNLVTMKWWDDLWLNEAFATWMAQKVMDIAYPQYQSELSLPQTAAFEEDALAATKAIRKEVKTEQDIEDGMGLNYSKGHAILNMFEQQLGKENFQLSIQQYMKKFSWKNTVANDLWQAFAQHSEHDIAKIASTYLDQPGYALVHFDEKGQISQQRFTNYGVKVAAQQWQVPLAIKYKLNDKVLTKNLLLADDKLIFEESIEAQWFFPVTNGNGYYRWHIPQDKYNALLNDLSVLNNREKMALLVNSDGLLNSGNITIDQHLALLTQLAKDPNAIVALNVIEALKRLGEQHTDQNNQQAFSDYITDVLTPWYTRIGSKTRAGDSDDILQLRPRLLRTLGQLGDNPALNKELVALAHQYLKGSSEIDDNLGREALRIAAMLDHGDLVKLYFDTYLTTNNANLKSNIMSSLYFTEQTAIDYSLSASFKDGIPSGDKMRPLTGAFYINKNQDQLYQWLTEHFDQFVAAIPQIYQSAMPYLMNTGCQAENVAKLTKFYQNKADIYHIGVEKMVEAENNCLVLKQREQQAFDDFLEKYQRAINKSITKPI